MTHSPAPKAGADRPAIPRELELTDRERALLDAWDAENAAPAPDHDEAFELQVLAAFREIDRQGLDELGDDDAAIRLQIQQDAEQEHRCEDRERSERNAAAFREVAEHHHDHLRMAALRLSGRRDTADDLVQDTMHRALVHFDRFAPGSNARAWLMRIMTNLYLDRVRHGSVTARAAGALEHEPAVEHDPDDGFLGVSDDVLWGAVDMLDADLRRVVELRYRAKLRYKDIARKLQLPAGTVATRLMRAHAQLLQLLRCRAA
jgi:RNA polymerase sigma-70 factor (ECF subfamily)